MPSGTQRMGFSPGTGGFSRVGPSPGTNGLPLQGSGHALAPLMPRAPAQPVNLKVLSLQGSAIVEEWSKSGTIRFETAVANRQWRQADALAHAEVLARHLDISKDSGLDIANEPAFEVPLRELAALWYADRHPKDQETADFLRESSKALDGVPRGMWWEARGSSPTGRNRATRSDRDAGARRRGRDRGRAWAVLPASPPICACV